jgi:hypothetical protein
MNKMICTVRQLFLTTIPSPLKIRIPLVKVVVACVFFMPVAANAISVKLEFAAVGFNVSNNNSAPDDPVSGTIIWTADSINSTVQSIDFVDLTINGHTYGVTDVGFSNDHASVIAIGANTFGVTGLANFSNDFYLRWDRNTLNPVGQFGYATKGVSGIWAAPYSSFSITAIPIPAAVWLFGSALAGLGWMRRKQTV